MKQQGLGSCGGSSWGLVILCVARSAGHDSKGREQDSASARLLDWGWVDTETKPDKQAEKSYMVQGY